MLEYMIAPTIKKGKIVFLIGAQHCTDGGMRQDISESCVSIEVKPTDVDGLLLAHIIMCGEGMQLYNTCTDKDHMLLLAMAKSAIKKSASAFLEFINEP